MRKLLIIFSVFLSVHAMATANTCFDTAKRYLQMIGPLPVSQDQYKVSVQTSYFSSEPTITYFFYNGILDSWSIELVQHDCFLIHIKFLGDL